MKISPQTLCHCVADFDRRPPESTAVMSKVDGEWKSLSWKDYFDRICHAASCLHVLGVGQGSRVAIVSNTRLEWSVLDFAVMGLGGWVIPVYQTVTPEDLEFIIGNSESEIVVLENRQLLRTYLTVAEHCPKVKKVICIDPVRDTDADYLSWSKFLELGDGKHFESEFKKSCRSIQPKDVATILYTSGTTGRPKGVVLTHESAFVEVSEAFPYCGARKTDVGLTFLPYAHILGRIEHWGHTYIGYTLAFAENIDRVRSNLAEIRPTLMVSVPRIFEKIYAAVQAQMDGNLVKRNLSKWALEIGLQVGEYRLRRAALPVVLALEYELAKKLVLSKVKEAFGGRLRFAISGGAPLSRDIALFFHACDVLILEGYGLTETTAAICVNTPFDYKFGSVGKPIGETQIKIAQDGEILIKSKKVMREYYKDPEATRAAFTDGWFHTGDIGNFISGGDLQITDRKKDLIKTAGGKYVAPQHLESLLKLHPIVSNVLIHGDQRKYIVALITLDKNFVLKFAKDNNISYSDYEALTQNPKVQELVRQAVAETNSNLANYETIKRFATLPSDFTVEAGELTPSLKVKRKLLDKKWEKKIAALYD